MTSGSCCLLYAEPFGDIIPRTHFMQEQPLSHSFEKIIQALYVYDMSRNSRGGPPNQEEQWAFHTVQSVLWRLAGIVLH